MFYYSNKFPFNDYKSFRLEKIKYSQENPQENFSSKLSSIFLSKENEVVKPKTSSQLPGYVKRKTYKYKKID